MALYNTTQLENFSIIITESTNSNVTSNETLPWYVNGEGAMAFSIAVILVFGMSIIFFIMLSINKTRTDREEEKQIWSYLKTYRQVRSSAIKDDEQRIRAKLLFMSILGENNTDSIIHHKVNGKVSKHWEKRLKVTPISRCLRNQSDGGHCVPKLSHSRIEDFLDDRLVTLRKSGELGSSRHENETEQVSVDEEYLQPLLLHDESDDNRVLVIKKTHMEPESESDSKESLTVEESTVSRDFDHKPQIFQDARRAGSVPNPSQDVSQIRLPQVASLKIIQSLKDDALEDNKSLSQSELETIRARRRKRSGYMAPKREQLEIVIPSEVKDNFYLENEIRCASVPPSPVQFTIGNDNILKPVRAGHYQKSANANKGQRTSTDQHKPRLTRRTQSFRFHDRKRTKNRKNSLELPGSVRYSHEPEDVEFGRSLKCRRHDRQSRISVVCLPDSDSGSSNDIILPAITVPRESTNFSDPEKSDNALLQGTLESVSRRTSVGSFNQNIGQDQGMTNNIESNIVIPAEIADDLGFETMKEQTDQNMLSARTSKAHNVRTQEKASISNSHKTLNLDTATALSAENTDVIPENVYPQKLSRNRRSGVINVHYKR